MPAAITGACDTAVGELPGSSCMGLHAEAALGAIADAGLALADIDGVLCAYSFSEPHLMLASVFCEHLGIHPGAVDPGLKLDHAAGVGGDDRIRIDLAHILHLRREQPRGHLPLDDVVDAGATATAIGMRHLDELDARD